MRILVACEESQAVCKELRRLGHEAYSCDIEPCSGGHPEWHLQCDALQLLKMQWDMIIAFPPCTYLSNAGACRLYPQKGQLNQERYEKGLQAKEFFLKFLNADCPRIAVENPVSSRVFDMPPHTQEIQPYQFDSDGTHPYTKRTRLWLRGLPPLAPTTPNEKPIGCYVPASTGRKDRNKYGFAKRGEDAKNRAKTFPGVAKAMAEQWG
ncbi:MAG: DNA cytosine methyltransferase [Eubacteriales bacterium]|nr:DNA cytosine methyltransferase [Eubacteriales bacterium]